MVGLGDPAASLHWVIIASPDSNRVVLSVAGHPGIHFTIGMAGGWIIRRTSLAGLVDARKVGLSGASLTGKDALEHISDHVGRRLAHGPLATW